MPTRNVVITDRQDELIEELVRSGKYQNASEILREGLRLIEERELEYVTKLQALRAAVQAGLESPVVAEFHTIAEMERYFMDLTEEAIAKVAGR